MKKLMTLALTLMVMFFMTNASLACCSECKCGCNEGKPCTCKKELPQIQEPDKSVVEAVELETNADNETVQKAITTTAESAKKDCDCDKCDCKECDKNCPCAEKCKCKTEEAKCKSEKCGCPDKKNCCESCKAGKDCTCPKTFKDRIKQLSKKFEKQEVKCNCDTKSSQKASEIIPATTVDLDSLPEKTINDITPVIQETVDLSSPSDESKAAE